MLELQIRTVLFNEKLGQTLLQIRAAQLLQFGTSVTNEGNFY